MSKKNALIIFFVSIIIAAYGAFILGVMVMLVDQYGRNWDWTDFWGIAGFAVGSLCMIVGTYGCFRCTKDYAEAAMLEKSCSLSTTVWVLRETSVEPGNDVSDSIYLFPNRRKAVAKLNAVIEDYQNKSGKFANRTKTVRSKTKFRSYDPDNCGDCFEASIESYNPDECIDLRFEESEIL